MILDINHPHDAFCREFFSHTDLAAELLARHLPVSSALDLSRLELVKDAFVDTDLQEHFSDLLFRAPFKRGGDAYACLVFEHKSKPYKWIGFQTLDYKTRLWGKPCVKARRSCRRLSRLCCIMGSGVGSTAVVSAIR